MGGEKSALNQKSENTLSDEKQEAGEVGKEGCGRRAEAQLLARPAEKAAKGGREGGGPECGPRFSPGASPPRKVLGRKGELIVPPKHSLDPRGAFSKAGRSPIAAAERASSPGEARAGACPARPRQLGRRIPPAAAAAAAAAFLPPRPPALAHFDAVEPGLQPELLNHFLHSGNAGGARHGAHDSQADSWVGGSWAVGRRGQTTKQRAAGAGLRTLSLSFRFCALRLHPRCACAPFPPSVPAPHQARSASLVEGEEKGRSSRWARLLGKRARLDS